VTNTNGTSRPPGRRIFGGEAALVTGASSGIGRAIAVGLGAIGMRVTLVGRRPDAFFFNDTATTEKGGIARAYACDLTDDEAVAAAGRAAIEWSDGRLAVLVHAAARYVGSSFEQTSSSDFDAIFRTNVRAPFVLTRLLLPALRAASGEVVFVNSSAAIAVGTNASAYAASKGALKVLADGLRNEINKDGIRVLSVYPGRTATSMQRELFSQEGREYRPDHLLQPGDITTAVIAAISLPATAELTDIHIRPATKS